MFLNSRPAALSASRTFTSLYVNPLLRILDQMNSIAGPDHARRGVFDMDPFKVLNLLVDFKTDGHECAYVFTCKRY